MLPCDLVYQAAGQTGEGQSEVGCQAGIATCVGQQARCCGSLQWPVALPYRAVASCCISRVPASAIIRSIFRQDDAPVFIHRWVDQYSLEEDLVEQLLQVGGRCLVEAVAVFEEVKGLGEVLVDFGGGGGGGG